MGRSEKSKLQQKEASRIYNKETREWCKANGICTQCRKAKVHKNHTVCLDCLDQINFSSENTRSEDSKVQRRLYVKRKRELCIAFGVCRECMCREAEEGHKCSRCKAKERAKSLKNSKTEERRMLDKCHFCGEDIVSGYRVCQSCLDRIRDMVKNRNKCDNSNHFWRKMDAYNIEIARNNAETYRTKKLKTQFKVNKSIKLKENI